VIAILVGIDGLRSGMAVWTALFRLLFIATVPLHILHKHVCSMAAEAVTLAVFFTGLCRCLLRKKGRIRRKKRSFFGFTT